MAGPIQAALLIPDDLQAIDDADARALVVRLFGDREVVNFLGTTTAERLELEEIAWSTPFHVPAREKALLARFTLRAGR